MARDNIETVTQTAVVLQGGGALGAYELGALERLFETPNFKPDILSGVSIGAINAAVLVGARGDPIETLRAMWDRFGVYSSPILPDVTEQFLSLFGNLSFFSMRTDFLNAPNWTSLYTMDPLRRELEQCVDFDKLNGSSTRLIMTATDVASGALTVFDNHDPGIHGEITVDHILASGSLPPGFPMTELNERHYWDGGLFDNAPLAPVIRRLKPDQPAQLIIVNVFPTAGRLPRNLLDVLDRTFELIFATHMDQDLDTLNHVNDLVRMMDEIDAALPEDSTVRDTETYRRLRRYRKISVMLIENENQELVFAPFDFSRSSIERRVKAGREDAERALSAA